MLGKLIKHEWKATWKVPTAMIVILMLTAILAGASLILPIWESDWIGLPLLGVMLLLLFYFAMIAVSIVVLIYLVIRFYKNTYTNEGYLTHTLPVSVHQLLQSKLIVMSAWILITALAIFASLFVFGGVVMLGMIPQVGYDWTKIVAPVKELLSSPVMEGWQSFIISLMGMIVVESISGPMMLIGAITIGQLLHKHRILGAIGAYFAIQSVMQVLVTVILIPHMVRIMQVIDENPNASMFTILSPIYAWSIVLSAALAVGLYFISAHIMSKKLELE